MDRGAGLPGADLRLRQGLGGGLDLEDAAGLDILARPQSRDRQADAGAGDRGADVDAIGLIGTGDRQPLFQARPLRSASTTVPMAVTMPYISLSS